MVPEYAGHAGGAVGSVEPAGSGPVGPACRREEVAVSYWFCLTHMAVEPDEGCAHAERLGPYPDRTAAQAALERAHRRSEEWDNDPRWSDADLED